MLTEPKLKFPLAAFCSTCPVVAPPVKTSPKSFMSVTPAAVVAGAHAEPFHCNTWLLVGAVVATLFNADKSAAPILASALASVKYLFVPSDKFVVDFVLKLVSAGVNVKTPVLLLYDKAPLPLALALVTLKLP